VTAEAIVMAAGTRSEDGEGPVRLAMLFDAHQARLYRLARRMSSSADDAQDLVQETFLRAARAIRSIPDGGRAEEAWLVRVLVNVCRDGWRRKAIRVQFALVHRPPSQTAAGDPEAAFVARTTIWRALQQLPPRRRAAIVMYELEGATISDIASLLGVSAVTVRWHLSRGRRELASVIAAYDNPAGGNGERS
jgi:RNA polymerase sigma-70 factor (ECF subfamily)